MIKWIKYDESNLPKLGEEFLVCTLAGYYKVAELELWSDGRYVWSETQEQLTVDNVMYYAEIDSPFK